MPTLDLIFACPRCHGELTEQDDEIDCRRCGTVGRRTLGYHDFTPTGSRLTLAANGTFDLEEDEQFAARVLAEGGSTFDEMSRFAAEIMAWTSGDDPREQRAVRRAAERYNCVECQAGDRHGQAILDKVGAYLQEHGRQLGNGRALEAGGGLGKYVQGFRERFDEVVFADCSLTNIVLASQLAAEHGLDHVRFVRADVAALPFAVDMFDFVHQNGLIEHVDDPVAMIREARRVAKADGWYTCLSPNRFPATPEPHFLLRFFGIYPPVIRRWLVQRTRGLSSEAGTDLRSLRGLRRAFLSAGVRDPHPFFLPPTLPSIARNTPVRRLAQRSLDRPVVRRVILALVNGPLLPIAPYHLVITSGDSSIDDHGRSGDTPWRRTNGGAPAPS